MAKNSAEERRRKNEEQMNFYSSSISAETLEIVRRRLAKRANQRMVRLERSESKISGKAYHIGAYDLAQEYLREQKNTDKKRLRFSEKLSQRNAEDFGSTEEYRQYLLEDIANIQSFLGAKSSTIAGNREIEAKRVKSFEKAGISPKVASSKGFYDFITSAAYKYFDARIISSDKLQDLFDYYTDADKGRGISEEDFQEVLDEYTDWLDRPENAGVSVKLKDLADRFDMFMIASDKYDTSDLEDRALAEGRFSEEELKKIKKEGYL